MPKYFHYRRFCCGKEQALCKEVKRGGAFLQKPAESEFCVVCGVSIFLVSLPAACLPCMWLNLDNKALSYSMETWTWDELFSSPSFLPTPCSSLSPYRSLEANSSSSIWRRELFNAPLWFFLLSAHAYNISTMQGCVF